MILRPTSSHFHDSTATAQSYTLTSPTRFPALLVHYITCNLADAFIQSDLQLISLSRRHTPWSNVGLRAVQMLLWPQQGSNQRPCGSKSSSLTTMTVHVMHGRLLQRMLWQGRLFSRIIRHQQFAYDQLEIPSYQLFLNLA